MKWVVGVFVILMMLSCSSNNDEKYRDINERMFSVNHVIAGGMSRWLKDYPMYALDHYPTNADSLTKWVYGFHKYQSENYGGVGGGRIYNTINENDSIFTHDLSEDKGHKYYEFTREHIALAKKAAELFYDTTKSFFEYRQLAKPIIKQIEIYKNDYIFYFEK